MSKLHQTFAPCLFPGELCQNSRLFDLLVLSSCFSSSLIDFGSLFNWMQNCISAIDGTHTPITISKDKAAAYMNRKGSLSQNVMLACDFDLNFTFISCGCE
jgi:hypothetical protein